MGIRGRGRPRVDDKRRKILDAALRVFAARGYDGTSVPEVATAAGVAVGSVYHYFEDKEALVNEVYRDSKVRLRAALLDEFPALNLYRLDESERWFAELWQRLAAFAAAEPDTFRFLEMQDHAPYLDAESRRLEQAVLAPLWLAGKRLRHATAGAPVDVLFALLWGAFVGLVKASRLGYLRLDPEALEHARQACWRMLAPGKRLTTAARPRVSDASSASPRSTSLGTRPPSRTRRPGPKPRRPSAQNRPRRPKG